MPKSETYLGDGLYASCEYGEVVLRAPREFGDHWVGLDSTVLLAFINFLKANGFKLETESESNSD